jgi:hypothetical protein
MFFDFFDKEEDKNKKSKIKHLNMIKTSMPSEEINYIMDFDNINDKFGNSTSIQYDFKFN